MDDMKFIIPQRIELMTANPVMVYEQPLAKGNSGAHVWQVTVTKNGRAFDLTGMTVGCYAVRSDGKIKHIGGRVSGCVAEVEFPQAFYASEGKLLAEMDLADADGHVVTTASLLCRVKDSRGDTVVEDVGSELPSVETMQAWIDAMKAATADGIAAAQEARNAAAEAVQTAEAAGTQAVSLAQAAGVQAISNANAAGAEAKATAETAAAKADAAREAIQGGLGLLRDQTGSLKSALNVQSEALEMAFEDSYQKSVILTEEKAIMDDGTLYDSTDSSFKHSKLVKVKYGNRYECSFDIGVMNFNFRVLGYTSDATDEIYSSETFVKQLCFTQPIVDSHNTVYFVVDDPSIEYVRFSGRCGSNFLIDGKVVCTGDFFTKSIYGSITDEISKYITEEYTNTSMWENGTFSGQNLMSSSARIRTIDYFDPEYFYSLYCGTNYEFIVLAWNKTTGAYIGTWGANGTAFVTSGTSSWVNYFEFIKFPEYKFKVALRNAVDTSATVTVSEATNAIFTHPKFAPADIETHSHAGYTRLYSDITSDIVWENKTITVDGIEDSATEVIAQLPSSGNIEIRMRYTTENSEFAVYQKIENTITLLSDWSHYQYRYTGDYQPEYYVRVKTSATNNCDFIMKHCLVIYKYCDQGFNFNKKTNMFGKKVAVFGDSIVQGKVEKNQATDVNSVTCKPWCSLIAEVNGDFDPQNFGIGGATVANAGTTTYPDWKSLFTLRNVITGFDIVFICAGINDYGAGVTEENFRTAYSAVLDALIANNTTVVVVTLCARTSNSANSAGLKPSDYANIEKEIGTEKGLKVIDLYTLTNNSEFKAQLPDGLHPNEIGHQMIANFILENY